MSELNPKLLPEGHLLNGEWYVQRVLGHDDMEIFYQAVGVQSGQTVVIREYFPAEIVVRAGFVMQARSDRDRQALQRSVQTYLEDFRSLVAIRHANISPVLDCFEENDTIYVTEPLMAGESLQAHLARVGRVEQEWLEDMLGGVLEGLAAMHDKGRMHLDLRPGNIFLREPDTQPLLRGSGLTRQVLRETLQWQRKADVKDFLAPEQFASDGKSLDELSDIYGLAATLHNCVTGKVPVSGVRRQKAVRDGQPDPQPIVMTDELQKMGYSAGFLRALDVGLALDRDERPRTLLEWNEQLFWDEKGAKHRYGRLWIEVEPADARIVVGDNQPYTAGMRLPSGECVVRVGAPYYQSVNLKLDIHEGENREQVTLSRFGSVLWVDTVPEHAGLRLDGVPFRSGDGVTIGDHELEVGAMGYKPQKSVLQIRQSRTRVKVELPRKSTPSMGASSSAVLVRAVQKNDFDRVYALIQAGIDPAIQDSDGRTALMAASVGKHERIVKLLLEQEGVGRVVNSRDDDGATALMLASEVGGDAIIRSLLGVEASVETTRWDGMTALMLACAGGHLETVRLLIRARTDIESRDEVGRTALMVASQAGHPAVVRELLTAQAVINASDNTDRTALMFAVSEGFSEIVEILLDAGVSVDLADSTGATALVRAAETGNIDIIDALLGAEANVNVRTKDGAMALDRAIAAGHAEAVARLHEVSARIVGAVAEGADVSRIGELLEAGYHVNARDKEERTALMAACELGDSGNAELLLRAGAQADMQDGQGRTALMMASGNGHENLVAMLLEAGVDSTLTDHDGHDALDCAIRGGYREIAFLLKAEEQLIEAAGGGRLERIRGLLGMGVDVNVQNHHGSTALMISAMQNHKDVTEELLQAGADPGIRDAQGKTATDHAVTSDHTEIAKLLKDASARLIVAASAGDISAIHELLAQGFDVNGRNSTNETALMNAGRAGHTEVVRGLLYAGAEVDAADFNEQTAFMQACAAGHVGVAEVLLEAGAAIDARDGAGRTALIQACDNRHARVVTMLLAADADPNTQDNGKRTPLMAACQVSSDSIIRMLQQSGADGDLTDDSGRTALIQACDANNPDVVELLLKTSVKVDLQDDAGRSALIIASEHGHARIARMLILAGAMVFLRDKNGQTALMHAAAGGHKKILLQLMKRLGLISMRRLSALRQKDNDGRTARVIARGSGHREAATFLTRAYLWAQSPVIFTLLLLVFLGGYWALLPNADEKLFAAVQANDLERIQSLLNDDDAFAFLRKSGLEDVNIADNDGRTPLMVASGSGNLGVVQQLVNLGADIEARDKMGRTAFLYAVETGGDRVFRVLVDLGVDIHVRDNSGRTALMDVSEIGFVRSVRALLALGVDVSARDNDGETALVKASRGGKQRIADILLEAGADVELSAFNGQTALMAASAAGHVDVVNLLISAGAETTRTDEKGDTALDYAAISGHREIAMLLEADAALLGFAAAGDARRTRNLLQTGAAVNVRGANGSTPLIEASSRGYAEVVRLLVDFGADLTIRDDSGRRAVDRATENGHQATVELLKAAASELVTTIRQGKGIQEVEALLAKGISPDIRDKEGQTAIFAAIDEQDIDILEILLQAGADLELLDPLGRTALVAAAEKDQREMSELLLESGFRNIDHDKGRALMTAVTRQNLEIVAIILRAGADPNLRDAQNLTPLLRSAMAGNIEIMNMLLDNKADINARSDTGETALLIAIREGFADMAIALVRAGATDGETALAAMERLGRLDMLRTVRRTAPGVLRVKVSPAQARIIIDGVETRYTEGMRLPLGEYRLVVNARHYRGRRLTVNLRAGENLHEMTLPLSEGRLFVEVQPEEDATLSLNGKPFTNGDWVPLGDYELQADAYGYYKPSVRRISVNSARVEEYIVMRTDLDIGDTFRDCASCPEMVLVGPGSFEMGSAPGEADGRDSERPRHRVTIASKFAMGRYEVTFAQWDACVRDESCNGYLPNDYNWGRDRHPVINISWNDAQEYLRWLNQRTGEVYRLPSEAEWEYAARAGTDTDYHSGISISMQQANFNSRTVSSEEDPASSWRARTTAVGSFMTNPYGLYDMHGNVQEWTQDCWYFNYENAPNDGSAWEGGECYYRVLRGGAWDDGAENIRVAFRRRNDPISRDPSFGFRVVREIPERRLR